MRGVFEGVLVGNWDRARLVRVARGPLGGLALVVLCLTVYLPGFFTIPPVDRDESRFAQASRQMFESVALAEVDRDSALHSGGWAVPMVGGKERLNKPPLIYWLQGTSAAVLTGGDPSRDAIWMYRVPSLVSGLVIALATWRIGIGMFGPVGGPLAGWIAGALLAVSPVFVWEAHQARADMVMVACSTVAMGCLWRVWAGARGGSAGWLAPVALWVCVGLGVMTKGPAPVLLVVLAAVWLAVFGRGGGGRGLLLAMRPVTGLVILVAMVAPWVVAVADQVGFDRYWSIVYDEVFVRAGSAKEGHAGPPGYHLVLLVVLFWPGSLLTGLSMARGWRLGYQSGGHGHADQQSRGRKHAEEHTDGAANPESSSTFLSRLRAVPRWVVGLRIARRPEAFLVAWLVPTWLVFEFVGTKLPHYTMPMYPAVALLTARGVLAWRSMSGARQTRARLGAWVWVGVGGLVAGGVGLGALFTIGGPLSFVAVVCVAFSTFGLVAIGRSVGRLEFLRAQVGSVAVAIVLLAGFLVGVAPGVFGLSRFADQTARELADGEAVTWVGFNEDSVVWFSRGRPNFTPPGELAAWFASHPRGVAVVSVYAEEAWRDRLELYSAVEVGGIHYAKGRMEKLCIVRRYPDE